MTNFRRLPSGVLLDLDAIACVLFDEPNMEEGRCAAVVSASGEPLLRNFFPSDYNALWTWAQSVPLLNASPLEAELTKARERIAELEREVEALKVKPFDHAAWVRRLKPGNHVEVRCCGDEWIEARVDFVDYSDIRISPALTNGREWFKAQHVRPIGGTP